MLFCAFYKYHILDLTYNFYSRGDIFKLKCIQLEHDNEQCPILPPDSQECIQQGSGNRITFDNVEEAREAYKIGMQMKENKFKRRKYVRGGMYMNIFLENSFEVDVQKYGGMVNLNIKVSSGEVSVLKIRDLSGEEESLKVIKDFSENCCKSSVARSSCGDSGSMYAFGYRNDSQGDYVSMRDLSKDGMTYTYNTVARKLLDKYFMDEVKDIIAADRKQDVIPTESMGGTEGLSAYCLVSRDLVNAAHYDLDTSFGISIFNERIPGRAKNWYFILPNTIVHGGNHDKAIIIKLFDGCTLSWDGRVIFHCTGTSKIGNGNHLYGNYWGGKVYH